MFSHFFIKRPRFAFVLSIIILLAGGISLPFLPVEQYPQITPPQVRVSAVYPGASAKTVETTIAQVIEEQVNGVDHMMYMDSSSTDGSYSLTITFEMGTDDDMAAVDVQNRISLATPSLPQEVANEGISVRKQSSNILMAYSIASPNHTYDELFLSNYTSMNIVDQLSRIDGVGGVTIFGEKKYSMRVWLNPERMTELGLAYSDVTAAIGEQNIQAAAGQVGKPPVENEQQFQYTVNVDGRLKSVDEFKNIIIKADAAGNILRLGDVARIELGSASYDAFSNFNGNRSIAFAIYQRTGSNALEVEQAVKDKIEELSKNFPEDVKYTEVYDATRFISVSLKELTETLLIALGLVIFVVYAFLQDWRTTIIPTLAIPVSLIGTLATFYAAGFTINTITLFGLVLAIGVVVDDAIVVVENTQRKVDEGLDRVTATRESMSEVTSPVIATTLVLLAVFVPVIFTPGIEGRLYQQFAITIAISVTISSFNALTLSPALCSLLLRKPEHGEKKMFLFRWFDKLLASQTSNFAAVANALVRRLVLSSFIFFASIGIMIYMFHIMPRGFIPSEDQGVLFVNVQLPDGSSINRTDEIMAKAEKQLLQIPGIKNVMAIRGFSIIAGQGTNKGFIIAPLESWEDRKDYRKSVGYILGQIYGGIAKEPGAQIIAFAPPAIMGLGMTGGFELALQNKTGMSDNEFSQYVQKAIIAANQDPRLKNVYTTYTANVPQIHLDVDRDRAKMLGVNVSDIFTTLQAYMGSINVNDFNVFGRTYNVTIMADTQYRDDVDDITKLYVRSTNGKMVPLSSLVKVSKELGQENIKRYNMFKYANINGNPAEGYSSGEAMNALEEVLRANMPSTIGFEWTGSALQERQSTGISNLLVISVIFMYLFLIAQYESSMMPLSILMVMPIAAIGGCGMALLGGTSLDLYAQIGMLVLVGIACKQGVLIVEFAKELQTKGKGLINASITALKLRFRAVMMTALSFVLGIAPLLFASGAGAGARISLGTVVFGGMVLSVVLATILVPVYFVIIETVRTNKKYPLEGTEGVEVTTTGAVQNDK